MAEKRSLKQVAKATCASVKATAKSAKDAVVKMPTDDKAIGALALGVGSWGLLSGVGSRGVLGTASLVAGVGAVALGFQGKESEKEPLQRASLWATALGSLSVAAWLVCHREGY